VEGEKEVCEGKKVVWWRKRRRKKEAEEEKEVGGFYIRTKCYVPINFNIE
jgi:hypothetical protein